MNALRHEALNDCDQLLDLSFLRPEAGGAMNYAEGFVSALPPDLRKRTVLLIPEGVRKALNLDSGFRVVHVADPYAGRLQAVVASRRSGKGVATHWAGNYIPPGARRTRTVVTLHDFMMRHYLDRGWSGGSRRRVQAALVDRSVRRASVVLVPDAEHAARVSALRPRGETVVAPLGPGRWILAKTSRDELPKRVLEAPYLLTLGGDAPHKRLKWFVEAFLADPRFAHLRIVHTGARLSLSDPRIVEMGRLDAPAMATLMEAALALVMPSSYEGFGLPVLEAAAFGVPAVTGLHTPSAAVAAQYGPVICCSGDDILDGVGEALSSARTCRDIGARQGIFDELWAHYVAQAEKAYLLARA